MWFLLWILYAHAHASSFHSRYYTHVAKKYQPCCSWYRLCSYWIRLIQTISAIKKSVVGFRSCQICRSSESTKHKPKTSDRKVFEPKVRKKLCEYYYIVFVWCGLEWVKCLCKPRSWQILSHSGVKILVRDSINDINSQDRRYRINKSTDLKNKHKRRLLTVQWWTLWVMFVHYYPNYSL